MSDRDEPAPATYDEALEVIRQASPAKLAAYLTLIIDASLKPRDQVASYTNTTVELRSQDLLVRTKSTIPTPAIVITDNDGTTVEDATLMRAIYIVLYALIAVYGLGDLAGLSDTAKERLIALFTAGTLFLQQRKE